jgi:serine/threonine protein kinase
MALAPGTRIGSYEVISLLGVGGMGEVYRAKDTRLPRHVALKLLPGTHTQDEERIGRLRREAEVVGTLNHPNIAALHDVQLHEGSPVLVMELVEGQTLAERIAGGPLPLAEALPVARQIAAALEFAHDSGVTHRDLKPANIKITPRQHVKVLDFGLAKLSRAEGGTPLDPRERTVPAPTHPNMILGTVPYMSPEQARGEPVDKTCDVWAFGCVFFELLTARQVFGRETFAATFSAILTEEPNWRLLPDEAPPALHALLKRCLCKNKTDRLRDMGDARIESAQIEGALGPRSAPPVASSVTDQSLVSIRRRFISAVGWRELVRLEYEVEQLLSQSPHDPELRVLRDDIHSARFTVAEPHPTQSIAVNSPRRAASRLSRLAGIALALALIAILCLALIYLATR